MGVERIQKIKWLDEDCHACGEQINSWDVRISKALAYKNFTCEKCIAVEYGKTVGELRARMEDIFGMRPCMGI